MLDYGKQDHGRFRSGLGDWQDKIKTGQVQPPEPPPPVEEIPEPLREMCVTWGYLPAARRERLHSPRRADRYAPSRGRTSMPRRRTGELPEKDSVSGVSYTRAVAAPGAPHASRGSGPPPCSDPTAVSTAVLVATAAAAGGRPGRAAALGGRHAALPPAGAARRASASATSA